jgi:hypothetical protein
MKLFYQLSESEQNNALQHCADIVIQDMIEEGIKLDPITEEEERLKEKLEEAVKYIESIPAKEDKISHLLGDPVVSKAIYEIALEMAKSTFYMEPEELIIFTSELSADKVKEENLLPEVNTKKSKKVSPLN